MKYLDHLFQDFNYFVKLFNLECLYESKEFDENYNTNKLIEKYKKEYIFILPEEAETKKSQILEKIFKKIEDKEVLINVVLSYTLILNYLVTKILKLEMLKYICQITIYLLQV